MFLLCEDDGEDSMGPAAGLIHIGGGHSSVGKRIWLLLRNLKNNMGGTRFPEQLNHFSIMICTAIES